MWASRDDVLVLNYYASAAPVRVDFNVKIRDRSGRIQTITGTETSFTVNRTLVLLTGNEKVNNPGEVVSGGVMGDWTGVKRGEFYCLLSLQKADIGVLICKGYKYENNWLGVGEFSESLSGPGLRRLLVVADDIAPADIQTPVGAANTRRRIDGFVWYYHCSGDVATRTLRATLRDLGDGLPTGMTSGDFTTLSAWPSAGVLTLTANEEGLIYVNANTGKSFSVSNDAGTRTIEDITTVPDPFPYWVTDDDVGEFFFNETTGNANDRHTIYIFMEEWIEL